jgi:N-acetyl sugar amidotransferase
MIYCKRCLYPANHPLNLIFNSEGICSGCMVHEEKDVINWQERSTKLTAIFESYRNKSGNNYDCIIPVSGARDSYFIVHMIKNVYKMNPLLVTYNKQYNTDVGVRNLANLRIQFDCDIMTLTVNPETVKKITRATMRKMGSIYWHCLAGQTVYPVQMAVKLKIPLIIWGAHQGVDQVGMFSHLDEVEMTRKYRKEHDLMGVEAEDLIDEFDGINRNDILPFLYPDDKELEQVGVRGIYLNNYIRWDSRLQHEEMISRYGYETAQLNRTFDTYNDIDCWNYADVHDYIKFLKHGYSKVVDHATREIRLGHMTREEGLILTSIYIKKRPENLKLFLNWIGMTENAFHYIIDQHRDKALWKRNEKWEWEFQIQDHPYLKSINFIENSDEKNNNGYFKLTVPKKSTDKKNEYILIGKGF